jgi:hypothetical protein
MAEWPASPQADYLPQFLSGSKRACCFDTSIVAF